MIGFKSDYLNFFLTLHSFAFFLINRTLRFQEPAEFQEIHFHVNFPHCLLSYKFLS